MKRILFLILTFAAEQFAFQKWFGCWLFKEDFYFTPQQLAIQIVDAQNADKGMPIFLIRAIHNKVLALGWGLLQTLLQYWDIRFLEAFIGLVGAIGVGLGLWYVCTKDRRNIALWVLFALGIIFPLIEMFFQPNIQYALILYAFGFVFQAISLYGIWRFLEKGSWQRYLLVLFLIVVSIATILIFPLGYQEFCLKI